MFPHRPFGGHGVARRQRFHDGPVRWHHPAGKEIVDLFLIDVNETIGQRLEVRPRGQYILSMRFRDVELLFY
jgi:hypothetical protein